MPVGEGENLAARAFGQERLQGVGEGERPQSEDRVQAVRRGGESDAVLASAAGIQEPRGEVGREKGGVARHADDEAGPGRRSLSPAQAGEHAGERPGEALDRVGDHRQAELGEARRVAVGVEHHRADLRLKPLQHMGEHRPAGQGPQRLVAAAHAGGAPAGKDDAGEGCRCWR